MILKLCLAVSGTSCPGLSCWIPEEWIPKIFCAMHLYRFLNKWKILEQCKCEICDDVLICDAAPIQCYGFNQISNIRVIQVHLLACKFKSHYTGMELRE